MDTEKPERRAEEELVTLVGPADQKDVTYLTGAGPIRLIDGKAHGVPLSVARKLAEGRRGWLIEHVPYVAIPRELCLKAGQEEEEGR